MLSSFAFKELKIEISSYLLEIEPKLSPLFKFIKKGTFLRDPNDELYQSRLIYTQELRRIVYNPHIFNEVLMDAHLKEQFFRTFGYKGNLEFTIYPKSWIRDLALEGLSFGKNVYLADGIVLGTNQVSPSQKKIRVGPIKIGDRSIFDQDCKIGLNTEIGQDCKVGVCSNIGIGCKIGNKVRVSAGAGISHFVTIHDNVSIGENCYIGSKSIIEDGAQLASNTQVPQKSRVTKQGQILPLY